MSSRTAHPARRVVLGVLAALALSSGGCLVFDRQHMVLSSSPDGKEARLLLIYEGLHTSREAPKAIADAKEMLTDVATSEKLALLGHPLIALPLGEDARGGPPRVRRLLARLRRNVKIGKATFFLSDTGRLCAYQVLSTADVRGFMKDMNASFRELILESLEPDPPYWLDKDSLARWKDGARKERDWIRYEPGRLSLTLPMTPWSCTEFRKALLNPHITAPQREMLERYQPLTEEARKLLIQQLHETEIIMAFLSENPVNIDQQSDRFVISLGLGDGAPIRLKLPTVPLDKKERNAGDKALIEHARTLNVPFRKDADIEGMIEEFVKGKVK
jgi:hypothetical protein